LPGILAVGIAFRIVNMLDGEVCAETLRRNFELLRDVTDNEVSRVSVPIT
jgi:hypothetical protein